jgi:hypothetical protein
MAKITGAVISRLAEGGSGFVVQVIEERAENYAAARWEAVRVKNG